MTKLNEDQVRCLIAEAVTSAEKAMVKFPQPSYVAAKLVEEAGEVVRAFIHRADGRATTEEFRAETVQLIGLALRLFFEGDETISKAAPSSPANPRRHQ